MDMDQKTKIMLAWELHEQDILAWELHEQDISNSQIAKRLEVNRETVNRWISAIRGQDQGLLGYLEGFRTGEKQPRPSRQIPLSTKQLVWQIREREENCCGQKIAYFLEKEHGIILSTPTIYAILIVRF